MTLAVLSEVEDLDELQHRRRELIAELAPIEAKWTDKQLVDARRRAFRSLIMCEIEKTPEWQGLVDKNAKSETRLERIACGDPRYHRYLRICASMAALAKELANDITEIEERIENRKSLIYAWGKEAGLQ